MNRSSKAESTDIGVIGTGDIDGAIVRISNRVLKVGCDTWSFNAARDAFSISATATK